ncbi:hypothetical protein FIM25_12695 [Desulfobotulus mexicanus]|uniref:Uncharacterized protein n=1 Tax=Desulfobotulus mexicanus TaxID=2586642 RepID=A0A5S5MDV6_9BACT|nr:hypothetical protein FIM25_12695 [Desulfobotulus mexicanus]
MVSPEKGLCKVWWQAAFFILQSIGFLVGLVQWGSRLWDGDEWNKSGLAKKREQNGPCRRYKSALPFTGKTDKN